MYVYCKVNLKSESDPNYKKLSYIYSTWKWRANFFFEEGEDMIFYYSQTKLYSCKFTFMLYNIMNYDISTLPDTLHSQFVYKTNTDKYAKNDGGVRIWQSDL